MTTISKMQHVQSAQMLHSTNKDICIKEDDNIFAHVLRQKGMNNFADFLRDDWSANIARKAGCDKFADWLENNDNENNNIFENIARSAIKHPILSIAIMSLSIVAGRQLYKSIINKSVSNVESTVNITKQNVTNISEPLTVEKPIDLIPKDIESVNKLIEEGIEYERKIKFTNLEIFDNMPVKEREKILSYFRHTNKEKDLLLFASGNKPALLEGVPCFNDDVFDAMRTESISVAEFFTNSKGNLIINNKEVAKVIQENLSFFQQRLGLPSTASTEDVLRIVKKSYANCLKDGSKTADLMGLLLGYAKYDAYHAQLVEDLRMLAKEDFYSIYRGDFEKYKTVLKNLVTDSRFTYSQMSPKFQAELIKKIDSLTLEAYKNLLIEPIHVFSDCSYEQKQLEALRNLALKLKQAQTEGARIGLL